MNFQEPNTIDIKNIVQQTMKMNVKDIKRFSTGLCHYVYDVTTNKKNLVLRIAHPDRSKYLKGALFWYDNLKSKEVPLPEIYYEDINAKQFPYHFYIMERLDGTDLGNIYPRLNKREKEEIVNQLVEIQNNVGRLPTGKGFGDIFTYTDSLQSKSWYSFFGKGDRTKEILKQLDIFDPQYVDILNKETLKHKNYFDKVKSLPFLDDITTKNVIIDKNNKLSGIVDVDLMTYGDKIFNIALTNMALLSRNYSTDYIDMWCQRIDMNDEEFEALRLYTLSHCVGFMCEVGQNFNKKEMPINKKNVKNLNNIFSSLR